jgi:hypothetical protein
MFLGSGRALFVKIMLKIVVFVDLLGFYKHFFDYKE